MSPRPPTSDSHAYVPQAAQQALARQMEHAVPAHLKQYVGNNAPAYIPPKVQQQLTGYLEKATAGSGHLQQYAGAYVQQNVVDAGMRRSFTPNPSSPPPKPVNPRNLSHSGAVPGAQADAMPFLNHFYPAADQTGAATTNASPQNQNPQPAPTQQPVINVPGQDPYVAPPVQPVNPYQQPPVDHSPYEFILNPQRPPKPGKFAGNSLPQRLLFVVGGLTVLVIAAVVVASLLSSSNTGATAQLVTVMQEQTELARIAGNATSVTNDSVTDGFAYSVQLSMVSAKQQLQTYMKDTNRKYNAGLLSLKHSAIDDKQLQSAQSNNTYNTTLVSILQSDLTKYSQALQNAYKANPGNRGQQLLKSQFEGAQLLIQQSKQQ